MYCIRVKTFELVNYWIYSWYIVMSIVYGPSGRFTHVMDILHCLEQVYAGIVFGYSSPYKGDSARFS